MPLLEGEKLELRILLDRPIIEVFLMGGRAAFVSHTAEFNSSRAAVRLHNRNQGGAAAPIVAEVAVHGMGCGWAAELPRPRTARKPH